MTENEKTDLPPSRKALSSEDDPFAALWGYIANGR
jgi:hypothetical protein